MSTPAFEPSPLIAGLWRLDTWGRDAAESAAWIAACVELGLDTFDLADIYGDHRCEELFGAALARDPGLRERLQLVSKCDIRFPSQRRPDVRVHHYDTSAAHIVASAERSLVNLHTERLDVLLLHRADPLMDADEVAGAFEALARAGKVLHFGVSNFTPAQLDLLAARTAMPLVTHQVEASVLHLAPFLDGTLDQLQRLRMVPMAWSPLAGGRLFERGDARAERVRVALRAVGDEHGGAPLDAVAFAFLLRHPAGVRPITGSGRLERLRTAAAARELALSREDWFRIWTASQGAPLR
jgi:predicted oxidoreductase